MLKFFLLFVLCLGVLELSACNIPDYGVLAVEPLTPNEARIEIAVGKRAEIVLPTPGVGSSYIWTFEELVTDAPLQFIEEKSATSLYPNRTPEGYAPDRVFVFEALRSGEQILVFSQTPKEGVSVPALDVKRTFTIKIR